MGGITFIWARTLSHFRTAHWHGRGVHSPFAYRFTRDVFMKRHCTPRGGEIYDLLTSSGINYRRSRIVQAAYNYLDCGECYVDSTQVIKPGNDGKGRMDIFISLPANEATFAGVPGNRVICLLSPRRNAAWYETCRHIVANHAGMSIDCRTAIFLFFLDGLNKEHIKL